MTRDHGGEVGVGGTSDADGKGFDMLQDFEVSMHNNHDEKLLNDHYKIEANVDNAIDNTTMTGPPGSTLLGAPAGWYPPLAPENWKPYPRRPESGEPSYESTDNPGNWSEYTYRAKFAGQNLTGKYVHHVTPVGAVTLPVDPVTGKRTKHGFELHYNHWKLPVQNDKYSRAGSTRADFFPEYRSSKLDAGYFTKMGLTPTRMRERDALWFSQLILPICDPSRSGIVDDP
jgi:hypothetical protein